MASRSGVKQIYVYSQSEDLVGLWGRRSHGQGLVSVTASNRIRRYDAFERCNDMIAARLWRSVRVRFGSWSTFGGDAFILLIHRDATKAPQQFAASIYRTVLGLCFW